MYAVLTAPAMLCVPSSVGRAPGSQQIVRRKKRDSAEADKSGTGGKWLAEEDARLRAGVEALGAKNWKRISEEYLNNGRTDVQCLHRWQKVGGRVAMVASLASARLVHARAAVTAPNWCALGRAPAPGCPNPSGSGRQTDELVDVHDRRVWLFGCLFRVTVQVLRPGLVKGPWTKDEDDTIVSCIEQGVTKWSEIAARIPGRIGKQCRERWFNHLDPAIKKGGWSVEEDRILEEQQALIGASRCLRGSACCGWATMPCNFRHP